MQYTTLDYQQNYAVQLAKSSDFSSVLRSPTYSIKLTKYFEQNPEPAPSSSDHLSIKRNRLHF